MPTGSKKGYASVDGLRMYYETHGSGEPVVLLHGGAGSTEMFADLTRVLSESHQVVATDLQAHGRTADIDRPLRYELMADDVAALTDELGLGRVDLMGYSLGGGVALRTAIQHPGKVRRLVLVSAPFKRQGWYPEVLSAMAQGGEPRNAEAMKQSPMYEVYSKIAPRVQDWAVMFAKLAELLQRDYDWSGEIAATMKSPTMLAFGDADSVRTAHAVEFFELLGGGRRDAGWDGSGMTESRLCILPGVTHYDIFASPGLVSAAKTFLVTPSAPNNA